MITREFIGECVTALHALANDEQPTMRPHVAVQLLAMGLIVPVERDGYRLTPEGHHLIIRARMRMFTTEREVA